MEPISEVCVVSTEKIKRWIRTALASGILDDELKSKLRNFVVDDKQGTKTRRVIPFSLVKSVHECIQTDQGKSSFLVMRRDTRGTSVLICYNLGLLFDPLNKNGFVTILNIIAHV